MSDQFNGLEAANEALCFHVLKYAGNREVAGPKSNEWILRMIRSYNRGVFRWASDDGEIAWCSIFMQLVGLDACIIIDPETNKGPTALAKSWLKSGRPVKVDEALAGDVAIFTRGGGGHVAVLARIDEANGDVWVFGGNQSNAVTLSPYKLSRLIGIRRMFIEGQHDQELREDYPGLNV